MNIHVAVNSYGKMVYAIQIYNDYIFGIQQYNTRILISTSFDRYRGFLNGNR